MTLNHGDLLDASMAPAPNGHRRLWHRSLSRRGFIAVGAGAAGALVSSSTAPSKKVPRCPPRCRGTCSGAAPRGAPR
jgi:hypothetical protein